MRGGAAVGFSVRMVCLGASFAVLVVAVVTLFGEGAASAGSSGRGFSDDFERIRSQPHGPWYVINWGSKDGEPRRREGQACGSDSCVRAVSGEGDSHAQLAIGPSRTPGFYVNAELAERRTGYAADQPGIWEPSPGHPVEVEARVRWSPNHDVSGGGGARGTSGVWLWNSPVDMSSPDYGDFQAFGLSWTSEGSAVLTGLNASVVQTTEYGPYPVWSAAPKRPVDLQEWNDLRIVWGEGRGGAQAVRFELNGEHLGTARLERPFGALSLELWSDNQVPTAEGIEYRNPTAVQAFEVDRVEVEKD